MNANARLAGPWIGVLMLIAAAPLAPVSAADPGKTRGADAAVTRSRRTEIARALSAATPAVAAAAAVATMDDKGTLTRVREGTNGWTCLPKDPGTPTEDPVCVDANGLAWYQAVMSGKEPDAEKVGYSYMLRGGSSWSSLDPSATGLPPGEKAYVSIPPHLMILNARLASASGFPSGAAHPDTRAPFVMYGGTPFAIIIIPVK